MIHPPPATVAIKVCRECGRVQVARHVTREDRVPVRYCGWCGTLVQVALYGFERVIPDALERTT